MLKHNAAVKADILLPQSLKRQDKVDFPALQTDVVQIVRGWAMSYVDLSTGCRQVTGIYLPGDYVSKPLSLMPCLETGVVALSDLELCAAGDDCPASVALQNRMLTVWLITVARRPALARVAYILCELYTRATSAKLVTGNSFKSPLLQEHLADAIGLTGVHVNRMLKELRRRQLAQVAVQTIRIFDFEGLKTLAGFDGLYLRQSISEN